MPRSHSQLEKVISQAVRVTKGYAPRYESRDIKKALKEAGYWYDRPGHPIYRERAEGVLASLCEKGLISHRAQRLGWKNIRSAIRDNWREKKNDSSPSLVDQKIALRVKERLALAVQPTSFSTITSGPARNSAPLPSSSRPFAQSPSKFPMPPLAPPPKLSSKPIDILGGND